MLKNNLGVSALVNESEEEVRVGMRQLNSEISAAKRAAGVGLVEVQRVVAELSSGPRGKAAVEGMVAAANAQVAATLCDCEGCKDAAAKIRGQSRLSRVRTWWLQWLNSRLNSRLNDQQNVQPF